jgi:mono/diheme cytochrome c family protein
MPSSSQGRLVRRVGPALSLLSGAVLALALIVGSGVVLAQTLGGADPGRQEYESACASCHGVSGRGDGPVGVFLIKPPSDLTTLARRSGGALPTQLVWEMIDGRSAADTGPHGSREMPVWGATYRARALGQPETAQQPEWQVRQRIVALLDYLERLQIQ